MHPSVDEYLGVLAAKRRAPRTIVAARSSLTLFAAWWEDRRGRRFDPTLLGEGDILDWCATRQREDGAAPATINRGLSLLRGYCGWATRRGLIAADPSVAVRGVPGPALSPKGLDAGAVDALLREARTIGAAPLRVRNEALLAVLVYAGVRVQEACDVQLRDLDLAAGTLIVRCGKAGNARRLPLHADAQRLLRRYLDQVRSGGRPPEVGSVEERAPLFVRRAMARPGRPFVAGVDQRLVQRLVKDLGTRAATRLRADAVGEPDLARAADLIRWARDLERVTPHALRHSLARRMLQRGARLSEVQRALGHSRLSTTGLYLTPSEDDLRAALDRAGV